jgi:hypothetical protein
MMVSNLIETGTCKWIAQYLVEGYNDVRRNTPFVLCLSFLLSCAFFFFFDEGGVFINLSSLWNYCDSHVTIATFTESKVKNKDGVVGARFWRYV